jgi:hypothetical protein
MSARKARPDVAWFDGGGGVCVLDATHARFAGLAGLAGFES